MATWCRALLCLLLAAPVYAQGTTSNVNNLRLLDGPCVITSVNGSPDKVKLTGCPNITTESATNLTLSPTGDLVLGPTGADVLPNTGYTQNLGALSNKYLTLHAAELWVETLVAQNTIATIGGRVLVAPTTTLTADLASGATSISVKHNEMANGDRVYLEANGKVEFIAVTSGSSGSGPYTYSITRNLDGSGANDWFAGDAVLNTGTTGDGFIDLYSFSGVLSGSGPTIVGNVRTGTTYSNIAPRWAIGNLNGLYGYGATTYGTAFGDASATNITIDATNGVRIRSGTTDKLVADTSGNLSLTGNLILGTSSVFRSTSATAFGTGDGLYLSGGTSPEFRLGNPAGNRLEYKTSTGILSIIGNGNGLTELDGGNITTNSINVGSLNATGFGDNVIKSGTFEGATIAIAASGWQAASTGTAPSLNCCGTNGPGTYFFNQGNGGQSNAYYRAVPVIAGQTYRVSVDTYMVTTTAAGLGIVIYESTSTSTSATYVVASGASGSQVNSTSSSVLFSGGQTGSTWSSREYTYTVPSGVSWVSLFIANATGSVSGSTYSDIHFDNIEMQRQLGTGHIQANSITSNLIAANTIVAGDIAAGTITADRLSVSTLSAITANLGTVTAGSISGVTATFGGGTVTLNSSGISITAGTGTANKIVWPSNGEIYGNGGGDLLLVGVDSVAMIAATSGVTVSSGNINIDPGSGGQIGTHFIGGGTRFVCVGNDGRLYSQVAACN